MRKETTFQNSNFIELMSPAGVRGKGLHEFTCV